MLILTLLPYRLRFICFLVFLNSQLIFGIQVALIRDGYMPSSPFKCQVFTMWIFLLLEYSGSVKVFKWWLQVNVLRVHTLSNIFLLTKMCTTHGNIMAQTYAWAWVIFASYRMIKWYNKSIFMSFDTWMNKYKHLLFFIYFFGIFN